MTVRVSQRSLAEKAQVSVNTVRRALSYLREHHYIRSLNRDAAHHRQELEVYELLPASVPLDVTEEVLDPGIISSSVFRNGTGLGAYARAVYSVVTRHPAGLRFGALVTLTGYAKSTVHKHLKVLAAHGLVVNDEGRWVPTDKIPDDVVAELPLAEKAKQDQVEQHRLQRELYAAVEEKWAKERYATPSFLGDA